MQVLDVAHILFGQVRSVLPSEKLNSTVLRALLAFDKCISFTHCRAFVMVSFFWFPLYLCRARLFVLSDTQLQLLCSNCYKFKSVISIHL